MHPRQPLPDTLLRLGVHQAGVVTTAQAERAGLTRSVIARSLRDGQLTSVARGVYGLGPAAPGWESLAWAGHLMGGEGSRIGGLGSAHLAGLLDEPPDVIEVLVPPGRRVARSGSRWRFVHEQSDVRWDLGRGSPPRITVEDTVLDLCAGASEREVVHWVTTAVQRRLTSPDRLRRRADGRTQVAHRRLVGALLADVAAGAETPLEVRFLRDVERAHGLPDGRRQRGPLTFVTDVCYESWSVVVELDGRRGHEGDGLFRDMFRDNAHVVVGVVTLRYGWVDVVDRPCEIAWQLARVLADRGWTGIPTTCPRCALVPR